MLLTQLNLYMEEKLEDEDDLRQARSLASRYSRNHERVRSESEAALLDLVQLAKQHGELYPTMLDILKHYGQLLQRDVGLYVFMLFCGIVTYGEIADSLKQIFSLSLIVLLSKQPCSIPCM